MRIRGKTRSCKWALIKNPDIRCAVEGVASHCPITCASYGGDCNSDSGRRFIILEKSTPTEPFSASCTWVARKQTKIRCAISGVADTCPVTCA